MDDRTNTIAGWVLAACATALAASIGAGMVFHGGEVEKEGYAIEGVATGDEGGAAPVDIATLLPTADAAKGADVFKKCAACHTITQGGANGIGPNLWGALGKSHGHVAGFAYSDALKSVPGNWDFRSMDAWLTSPRRYAPGTKMTFAGLSNPEERANLLVYMNQQGSNLPLPAPQAPAAVAGANETAEASGVPVEQAEAKAAAQTAQTADVANAAAPASGAPSVDPAAAKRAPE